MLSLCTTECCVPGLPYRNPHASCHSASLFSSLARKPRQTWLRILALSPTGYVTLDRPLALNLVFLICTLGLREPVLQRLCED